MFILNIFTLPTIALLILTMALTLLRMTLTILSTRYSLKGIPVKFTKYQFKTKYALSENQEPKLVNYLFVI